MKESDMTGTGPAPWKHIQTVSEVDGEVFNYVEFAEGQRVEFSEGRARMIVLVAKAAVQLPETRETLRAAAHLLEMKMWPTTQPAGSEQWDRLVRTFFKNHPELLEHPLPAPRAKRP